MIAARRYASVQNDTASKERLMVNLFQTALRHMRSGAADLGDRSPQKRRNAMKTLDKAAQIVGYLQGTLNREAAPKLADELKEIYTFTAARLCRAVATGNVGDVREAERAFAPIADGFAQAVAKMTPAPAAGVRP
jgi:flagellar biosynthetic protein FliS